MSPRSNENPGRRHKRDEDEDDEDEKAAPAAGAPPEDAPSEDDDEDGGGEDEGSEDAQDLAEIAAEIAEREARAAAPAAATPGKNGHAKARKKTAAATPPTRSTRRRPKKMPRARQPVDETMRPSDDATQSPMFDGAEAPPLETEPFGGGPSPLESVTPENSAFLRVVRIEANGPANGYEDGDDYVGPCGRIPHKWDFESVMRRRWGGGNYEISATVKGKVVSKHVPIGGPSFSVDQDERYDPGYASNVIPFSSYQRPPLAPSYAGASTPYASSPGYPGYSAPAPGAPFGGSGGPWQQPQHPFGPGYQSHPNAVVQFGPQAATLEEARQLREQLELAREQERRAREEAAVEKVRRESEQRESSHKAEMQTIVAKLEKNSQSAEGSSLAEMMKLQMQQQNTRLEEERLARDERRAEEDKRWREQQAAETKRRDDERERYDREYRERRDREEKERKEENDRRAEERRLAAEEKERNEKYMERWMGIMQHGQLKPEKMFELMHSIGNSGTKQFLETAQVLETLRGDEGEDDKFSKAERVLRTVGETGSALISEVGKQFAKPEQPPPPPQPPQQTQYVYLPPPGYAPVPGYGAPQRYAQAALPAPPPQRALPGPTAPQGPTAQQVAAVRAQAAQVEREGGGTGISPLQWGKILEFAVDSCFGGHKPSATAEHLTTTIRAIEALPAIDVLGTTQLPVLRGKVRVLLLSGRVTSQHYAQKMRQFMEITSNEKGARWFQGLLAQMASLYQQLVATRAQQQQRAVQAQAPPQAIAPPVPGTVPVPVPVPQPVPADGGGPPPPEEDEDDDDDWEDDEEGDEDDEDDEAPGGQTF